MPSVLGSQPLVGGHLATQSGPWHPWIGGPKADIRSDINEAALPRSPLRRKLTATNGRFRLIRLHEFRDRSVDVRGGLL